jgi:hypothetical protein
MPKFQIETVETIVRCYHIETDSDDADAAIDTFALATPEELERFLVYTNCHGEAVDLIEILEETE